MADEKKEPMPQEKEVYILARQIGQTVATGAMKMVGKASPDGATWAVAQSTVASQILFSSWMAILDKAGRDTADQWLDNTLTDVQELLKKQGIEMRVFILRKGLEKPEEKTGGGGGA